ncbi:MAG: hypothetical protein PHG97_01250 [Candidatus Margulisbacteria bacterium]|nr:hypothetical protein [Candidatus Margulisiibacteriota bacterium]
MKIGRLERLILFGGGRLLVEAAKAARRRGLEVYVFAVRRHLEEKLDGDLRLKDFLAKEKIAYFETKDVNRAKEFSSLVSAKTMGLGFGEEYTFDQKTIDLFKGKLFDFMVIKLPQYRGGAHFTWQILRQDRQGAWNVQVINAEMVQSVFDSGEILKTKLYKIPRAARLPQDYFRVSEREGLKFFIEFLAEIKAGRDFKLRRLAEKRSLYLPRLFTLKHGFINWDWNLAEIESFVCAFDEPYPGASTFLNDKRVVIKACTAGRPDGKFHPFIAGLIYRIFKGVVHIAVRDGTLLAKQVLDGKGRNIVGELKPGDRFYTPLKYLEAARLFNAQYDSEGLKT